MITNPDVARVLDKAADYVSETAVMPTKLTSKGRNHGDVGFDAFSAVAFAMIDLDFIDDLEHQAGLPHSHEIMQIVADFGGVPEDDRTTQDMRFEVGGHELGKITRRMRRTDDMIMWGRGLATSEVAALYRSSAEEFRARPADQGVYDVYGTHEHYASRGGAFVKSIRKIAKVNASGDEIGTGIMGMAILGMLNSVFIEQQTEDPEAGVVVRQSEVTPARIAEIAQGVIDLINELGWTDTYLFNPQTGAVSIRGAAALVLDLPPRADYLSSELHRTERRWAELWAFDEAVADYLAIPEGEHPCAGCGNVHDRDRLAPWENDGRDQAEIMAALTGTRDAQAAVAAFDAGLNDVDWDEFTRQIAGGGTAN